MAQYRHLPIWKAALDLAVHLERAVRRFSRYNKYTLGSDLRQTAQRLCRLVARANDRSRIAHALAGQTGHFKTGFKRRAMQLIWRPSANPCQ